VKGNELNIDLYELTMAQVYFHRKQFSSATFELFLRSDKRPFYVASGIDQALVYLENLRFTKEDINYLRSLQLFDDEFLGYLHQFKFNGEVWAVEDPEIVFPKEPILRVTGNLIEVQIVESALLNILNLATTLATKATRVVLSAQGKAVYDFSFRRTQGFQAAMAVAKYSYMAGVNGTSNVSAGFHYGIPVVGTMAHSFVMTFEREIESFLAFSQQYPQNTILLVDTYTTENGIQSAVTIGRFLKNKGIALRGIRLDSGDLAKDALYARAALDKAGLSKTIILASGDLNEQKIEALIKNQAPIDAFGVGSHLGCSSDYPFSDVIYKLVELKNQGQKFIPTMKFSQNKISYPGKKNVFRWLNKRGLIERDCIGVHNESQSGKKLLKKRMSLGRRLYKETTLDQKRSVLKKKQKTLPGYLCQASGSSKKYPVTFSARLMKVVKRCKHELKKRIAERRVFFDIDTQYDFLLPDGALAIKDAHSICDNLRSLFSYAKKNNILVFSTQDLHRKHDPEFHDFSPHCVRGTYGAKKMSGTILNQHKAISSKKIYHPQQLQKMLGTYQQFIFEKDVLNVFANINMRELFEIVFPEKVYIFGVATEYCVKEAVQGLQESGFSVTIVVDAIKEYSRQEKNRLFRRWEKQGVSFITTAELVSTE